MKKKLFENVGGNKFKMMSETERPHFPTEKNYDNPTYDLFDSMVDKIDPNHYESAEVYQALDKYFGEVGKNAYTIKTAQRVLKYRELDHGLVSDYLKDMAGASNNPDDSDSD